MFFGGIVMSSLIMSYVVLPLCVIGFFISAKLLWKNPFCKYSRVKEITLKDLNERSLELLKTPVPFKERLSRRIENVRYSFSNIFTISFFKKPFKKAGSNNSFFSKSDSYLDRSSSASTVNQSIGVGNSCDGSSCGE